MSESGPGAVFDPVAADYDVELNRGLNATGEKKEYFARRRVGWLAELLRRVEEKPKVVLDFGCGTGSTVPLLVSILQAQSVVGIDHSAELLARASAAYGSPNVRFCATDRYRPASDVDLVFSNGVFHHIPPHERPAAMAFVYQSLRPGGIFALWENNPWNPGTRYVMHRISFDRDAAPLRASEARSLAGFSGFHVCRTDYLFLFPARLGWLRFLEAPLSRLPLGGQYQVLCRKP